MALIGKFQALLERILMDTLYSKLKRLAVTVMMYLKCAAMQNASISATTCIPVINTVMITIMVTYVNIFRVHSIWLQQQMSLL